MANQRDLFEILYGGRRLAVAVTRRGRQRLYVGAINGEVCATAPGKGDLLRALIQMARHYPKEAFAG